DMPTSRKGIESQRARWEGGRFRMIREHVPALLGEVRAGELRMLEPLGELLLLPLATHVGTLACVLVIPFAPTQLYAAGALGLAALWVGGGTAQDLGALARAPLYVVEKAMQLPALLRAARKDQPWVRTARDGEDAAAAA